MDSSLTIDTTKKVRFITDSIDVLNYPVVMSGDIIPSGIRLTDTTYLIVGSTSHGYYKNNGLIVETDLLYSITDEHFRPKKYLFFGKQDTMDLPFFKSLDKYQQNVYMAFFYAPFKKPMIGLNKMDLQGNILWTKYYNNGRYNEGEVVLATEDGGALVVTRAFNPSSSSFDLYILKVDSNGNSPLTVNIEESPVIDAFDYSIYPNPAQKQLNFRKFNHFMPYEVRLFDAFGREVKIFDWIEDLKTISIADLASGVYIYRITDEKGRTASGKVVKE